MTEYEIQQAVARLAPEEVASPERWAVWLIESLERVGVGLFAKDLKQRVGNLLEGDRAYEWMEERFTDGRVAALEDVLELLEGPHPSSRF